MTVTGPVAVGSMPPMRSISCREWLLNDQSALLQRQGEHKYPAPGDRVELRNLTAMRRWPLATLNNLHLSKEDALQEMQGPAKQQYGTSMIVVSTPRQFWTSPMDPWSHAVSLQALSQETGMLVVGGTMPAPGRPASIDDFETEVARLQTDLAVGFEAAPPQGGADRIRPGLIGELPLGGDDLLTLRVCVEAQRRSRAPLLLSGPVSHEALAILEGTAGLPGSGGSCFWNSCAFFDVPSYSPVTVEQLAARGAFIGFSPPPATADIAWQDYVGRRPLRTEREFLEAVRSVASGNVLVSSSLRFRTDLAACGGPGLSYASELLLTARQTGDASLPQEEVLSSTSMSFLQYPWKPPPPPEKVEHLIECHWCGTQKKQGDHFSKLGFNYCTPKCLAQHRKADFAPNVSGRT